LIFVKAVKLILRNINVLNMLLLAVAVVLFFLFDYPLLGGQASIVQIQARETGAPIQSEEKSAPEGSASYADFISIAEKNLFHPEREMPKAEKAAAPKPELILYGTVITDDVSIAYVEDRKSPYSTPGRPKRQTALKKGGSIGGYVLREIEPNRIVLVRGEDKLVVMLDDKGKRAGDEKTTSSPLKGPTGAFPPASPTPAAPQVTTPSPGAAISTAPQVMTTPPGAAVSPGQARIMQRLEMRNQRLQTGGTPP
jgi:type II secretory pathway component PulC